MPPPSTPPIPDNGGSGAGQRWTSEKRIFKKENTVIVNVEDNSALKAESLISSVTELCGEGSILACVPKSGNLFELTLDGRSPINIIIDGVEINGKKYECREAVQIYTLVSFLHLPAYISDTEISEKMQSLGVELVSPIKRRYYKGTNIADGTRYVRVKLPENIKSLPYTMKFGKEYYRVLHDNQLKVCSLCYSDEHLFKDCPQFVCFKCKGQGHYARACRTPPCTRCGTVCFDCKCVDSSQSRSREFSLCSMCKQYDCTCFETNDPCVDCGKMVCSCEESQIMRNDDDDDDAYDNGNDSGGDDEVGRQEINRDAVQSSVAITSDTAEVASATNQVTVEHAEDTDIPVDDSIPVDKLKGSLWSEGGSDVHTEGEDSDSNENNNFSSFKWKSVSQKGKIKKRRPKKNLKEADIRKFKASVGIAK